MRTRISLSIASTCLSFLLLFVSEAACGRSAIAQEVRSRQQVDPSSTETTSEVNTLTFPAPVLYLPGDPSVATVPRTVAFTKKGGRYAAGKIGQAISFDGNTFTELEAPLPVGNAPRTMAFWVRNDRGPVKHIVQVVTQTVRWEKAKAFGIIEAGGNWRFHDMNGGLDSSVKIDREWHHLAITHDGKTICFFLDGKKVAEAERNLETESRKLRIGGLGSPENNFVGLIDELYVFDVPLTEDQIRQLMNGVASSSTNGNASDIQVAVGDRRTIMPDNYQGLRYFPDEPIGIISEKPLTFTMVAGNSTVLMQGRSLETAVPLGQILAPTGRDADFDADYAGISSVYVDSKRKEILGFYHAERHRKGTVSYTGGQKWYGTIALAVSRDGGRTWERKGPIITSAVPFDPNSPRTSQGVGDVSVCVDHSRSYLYAYYTEHSRIDGRSVIICMARSRVEDGGRPGTWKKYHAGSFSTEGIGGKDTQIADLYGPNVTYIHSLKKYVMVGNRSGIHFCHSDDGIHWSMNQNLVSDGASVPYPGEPTAMRAHLQILRSDSNEASGMLLYTYSPKWGGDKDQIPHYFVKRPITLKLSATEGGDATMEKRLAGTKWKNSNGVNFEWTADGRFLHNGVERDWKMLDERRARIVFGPGHEDTLEFSDDLKTFKQLIKDGPSSFTGRRQ